MAEIVKRFTKPGDTVLDPFCGGGTTGVAALKNGRKFIGVDIDEAAIETTKRRIAALQGEPDEEPGEPEVEGA